MKRNHLMAIALLFLSFLAIYSCRRDINNMLNDQVVPTSALESAKKWHAMHALNVSAPYTKLNPKWGDSWMVKSGGQQLLVVEAPESPLSNPDYTIRRVFVFSLSGNNVTNGEIIEFLGNKYDVSDNLNNLTANFHKDAIDGFNGSIFEYDINYQQISSAVFKDGKKLDVRANYVSIKGKLLNPGRSPVTSSLKTNYWVPVTYDNSWPPQGSVGADCIVDYEEDDYYTNGTIDYIVMHLISITCPSAGSDSSASGTQESGTPYGGLPTGVEITGGNPTPPTTGLPPNDPCSQISTVNAQASSTVYQSAQTTLHNQLATAGNREWGANVAVSQFPGVLEQHILTTTPRVASPGIPDFEWDPPAPVWRVDGMTTVGTNSEPYGEFTIGTIHTHPNGKAPSIQDVFHMADNGANIPSSTENENVFNYHQEAFITAVTSAGNYTVKVNDWAALQTAVTAAGTSRDTYKINDYTSAFKDYLRDNEGYLSDGETPNPSVIGDASAYALMQALPGVVNVFKSNAATPNTFYPIQNSPVNGHARMAQKPC